MLPTHLFLPIMILFVSTFTYGLPEKNRITSPEDAINRLESALDQLSRENLEKEKGGKLNLKEKIIAGLFRKKINKKIKRIEKGKEDGLANVSIGLGSGAVLSMLLAFLVPAFFIVGLLLAVVGLSIAVTAKRKTNSPRANGGLIINGVALAIGIIVLLIAFVLVAIAF